MGASPGSRPQPSGTEPGLAPIRLMLKEIDGLRSPLLVLVR